jgi:hypothetical protein
MVTLFYTGNNEKLDIRQRFYMFENLSDLRYVRSSRQAIGFYIAYVLLGIMAISLLGAILFATGLLGADGDEAQQSAESVVHYMVMVYCMAMAYFVAAKKNISIAHMSLAIVGAGFLSIFDVLGGMIVPAYLTTKAFTFDK